MEQDRERHGKQGGAEKTGTRETTPLASGHAQLGPEGAFPKSACSGFDFQSSVSQSLAQQHAAVHFCLNDPRSECWPGLTGQLPDGRRNLGRPTGRPWPLDKETKRRGALEERRRTKAQHGTSSKD